MSVYVHAFKCWILPATSFLHHSSAHVMLVSLLFSPIDFQVPGIAAHILHLRMDMSTSASMQLVPGRHDFLLPS
jgi:hypothetical protein